MTQSHRIAAWALALVAAAIFGGCSSQAPQDKPKATPPAEKTAQEQPAVQGESAPPEGLAELSASDRAAAEKQRVCPVSGEVLGAMGKPYKVTVKGQTVFLCCSGCEKELMANPDKYLAKIQVGKTK
jgi:hypothetical protein